VLVGGGVGVTLYVPKIRGISDEWYARRSGRLEMSGKMARRIDVMMRMNE
jgi:hypothetical protein